MTEQDHPDDIDDSSAVRPLAETLSRAFEHAPALIVVLEGPGHLIRYANRAFVAACRARPMLNRPVGDAVPELAEQRLLLDRCYRTGEPITANGSPLETPGPDGRRRVRYFDFVYQPVPGPDGKVRGIIGHGSDVTDRLVAERDLRRARALDAAILDASLDAIVSIDSNSRIVEWNAAAQRIFGFSRDEALGRDLAALIIPPENRAAHRRGMARYLSAGTGPVIGRRVEVVGQTRDGSMIPIELAISPISLDGEPHFTAYLRDIRAQKEAETALRQSEERLRATYEHAFVGIGEVDLAGRFVRANEQFSVITGFSRDELFARSIWDITHPEDAEKEKVLFARHIRGDLPAYRLEKRYVHKSGRDVWVELAASLVTGSAGEPSYGVRVVRDVSDRRLWQERQRLLVNELNHRVKNTLATVQSIAAQTWRGVADPKTAYASFADRLVALAASHDVLTREQWRGADLGDIVRASIRPFGGGSSDRFRVEGPTVWLPPQAALALGMALHELATNAAKHGALAASSGRVEIRWALSEAGRKLTLEWREHGGAPVTPPTAKGFGARLLAGLASELRGAVALDFPPAGAVCTITADLGALPQPPGAQT